MIRAQTNLAFDILFDITAKYLNGLLNVAIK